MSKLGEPVTRSELAFALTHIRSAQVGLAALITDLVNRNAEAAKEAYDMFKRADKEIEALIIKLAELEDGNE